MKRRAFFGLMGGAAVAGPSAAKQAIAKLPNGLGDAMISMAPPQGILSSGQATYDSAWKMKEIASLKRILTGDLTEQEKEERRRSRLYAQQSVIGQGVASLISVSGVRKLEIFRDRMETHNQRVHESEIRSRLHWLLRDDT